MVELMVFPYDPQLWHKQRRWQWLLLLLLPLPGLICSLFTPLAIMSNVEITLIVMVGAVTLLLLTVIVYWVQQTSFRAQLKSYVVLKEDRLEHVDVKAVQSKREPVATRYQDLTDLIIHQDASGKTITIRLVTRQKSVSLAGFTHLEQLAAALRERLPASCRVNVKRPKRYVLPALFFLVLIVLPLVWIVWWQELGTDFIWLLPIPLEIYLAFRFLVYRPLGKVDPKSQWMDPVLGLMLVGLLMFRLVTHLDTVAAAFSDAPCSLSQRLRAQSGCLYVVPNAATLYFLDDNRTVIWRQFDYLLFASPTEWLDARTPILRHDNTVYSFRLSADRQTVATLSGELWESFTIRVWQVQERQRLWEIVYNDDWPPREYALAPDGTLVAIVEKENIRLVDLKSGVESFLPLLSGNVSGLVFTPDGTQLLTIVDGVPTIYDVTGQSEPHVLPAAAEKIDTSFVEVAISPDGQYLGVVSGETGTILVWNLNSGEIWQQLIFPALGLDRGITFSPDSRYLAVAGWGIEDQESQLSLWRVEDGVELVLLILGEKHDYQSNSVDFSPDGTLLAVGTHDGGLIFDVERLLNSDFTQ